MYDLHLKKLKKSLENIWLLKKNCLSLHRRVIKRTLAQGAELERKMHFYGKTFAKRDERNVQLPRFS